MKLFVFDIDDTISSTALIHQEFFINSLNQLGVKKLNTDFGSYKHHTDSYIAKQIYELDRKVPFTQDLLLAYEMKVLDQFKPIEIREVAGAVKFIKELEQENIAIAYVTGAVRKTAEFKLEQLGIPFHEKQLVASNYIEDREGIVTKAIIQAKELNGVENFEDIYSFGDGIWDFKTAKALNLKFVGIGKRNKQQLIKAGTALYFDDYQEDGMLQKILHKKR